MAPTAFSPAPLERGSHVLLNKTVDVEAGSPVPHKIGNDVTIPALHGTAQNKRSGVGTDTGALIPLFDHQEVSSLKNFNPPAFDDVPPLLPAPPLLNQISQPDPRKQRDSTALATANPKVKRFEPI